MSMIKWLFRLFSFAAISVIESHASKPNIVFVVADDYGFNDVGYHGTNHGSAIETPFLDSLAMSGIRLENYYVQPICSPTRSQLLSGRYQIHTGLQHGVIHPSQPNGLPLNNILLSEQLKKCGYATHMLGKWHLGFFKDNYLPWNRGFDKYFGYLVGSEDYFTKKRCYEEKFCGYSMNSETGPTNETYGEYSAHLYARKAGEMIDKHDKSNPLFMYIALQSVHYPLQVPPEYVTPYSYIKDENRRTYAGMVSAMDEAINNITEHLKKAGMWNNTLFIFSTDNGGQTIHGGNNWPLRGRKDTLWEGGIRGVGFVHGSLLNVPNPNVRTNNELIHVSDWYPTLLHASGCPVMSGTQSLDGFDQWETISRYAVSPRTELLHNIDPLFSSSVQPHMMMGFDTSVHAGIRVGDWKLLTGDPGFDDWVEPPEWKNEMRSNLSTANITKSKRLSSKTVQLFNIKFDPYERTEVSELYPGVVKEMLVRLAQYNATAVPVSFPPDDARADPSQHGGYWGPWET